jgi:hypothetical protein
MARLPRAAAILGACALACDVSDPTRFFGDAGADPCAPIFAPGETILADLSCQQPPCTVTVHQDRCDLQVRIATCTTFSIDGRIDDEGTPIWTPSMTAGTCVDTTPPAGAKLSLACSRGPLDCGIDLFTGVDRSDEFTVTPLVIDPLNTFRAPRGEGERFMALFTPVTGWLAGAVMLEKNIVVARQHRFDNPLACTRTASSTFELVDMTSFSVMGSVPSPSCTTDLVKDPLGEGFIAAYGGPTPAIATFDKDAKMLKSRSIAASPEHIAIDLDAAGDRLYVLLTTNTSTSYVEVYTLPELGFAGRTYGYANNARAVLSVMPGGIAISDLQQKGIRLVDALLGDIGVLSMSSPRVSSDDPGYLARADDTFLLASATGPFAAIWVFDPASPDPVIGEGVPYERPVVPWAIARYQASTVLAGVTAREEDHEAYVAVFDLGGAHFLPGMVPIGRGAVRELLRDPRGVYYALLPWEGTLVRIEPR